MYIKFIDLTFENKLVIKELIVIKVIEKSIFIHNIKVTYIGDYTVIDKWKNYKS